MPGARIASGQRVALRTLESEDLPFYQRAHANPEIRYPSGTRLANRDRTEEWLGDDADRFLVCLDDEDAGPGRPDGDAARRIGAVSVHDADWKRPELTYWLVPEVRGEGYGTEAVALVVDYVFRTYDTPAVGAVVYDFNDASRNLLESLEFEREGRRRGYRFVDGEYRDGIQYGLLRRTWRERDRP